MERRHNKPATKLLYEELRLIEKSESEVNVAWKGAHILLFFLAFVFGSFCTFCFHLLMYLFEEKCVLFPKLLTLASSHPNVIYELIPEGEEMLSVDFVSTQWIDKSACYLPTYVPLVSGIFGLVWTTMFLMCSTGRETLTGLQRPWRVIPAVFIFSMAMGIVCFYTSAVTNQGLDELCNKLGEITGSSSCSYSINVATLLYERKIRGVYQATRLTICTAWLHTFCWILSALLALVRILLVVDFRLVKVKVELIGDVEKMLERNEQQLRTVSPASTDDKNIQHFDIHDDTLREILTDNRIEEIHPEKRTFNTGSPEIAQFASLENDLFFNERPPQTSALALKHDEEMKLIQLKAYDLPKIERYINKMLYDLIEDIDFPDSEFTSPTVSIDVRILKQNEQEFTSLSDIFDSYDNGEVRRESLIGQTEPESGSLKKGDDEDTLKRTTRIAFGSVMELNSEMKHILTSSDDEDCTQSGRSPVTKKSSLKKKKKKKMKDKRTRVIISDSRDSIIAVSSEISSDSKADKETQTYKAKQD